MKQLLVTDGSGFLGEVLLRRLLDEGYRCTSIDLQPNPLQHPCLTAIQGDIRDSRAMEAVFSSGPYAAVLHCAAVLAHGTVDRHFLWTSNVDGTRKVAEFVLFDTSKIKSRLSWHPTLTNEEMLVRAYDYYRRNRNDIAKRVHVSAHKQVAKMGIIRFLKAIS